jgi:hypothetical protein
MYGACAYCNCECVLTKEHVVPKSLGGTYTIGVCNTCNQKRGVNLEYPPFLKWLDKFLTENIPEMDKRFPDLRIR